MAQVYISQYARRAAVADSTDSASYAATASYVNPIRLDPIQDPNPTGLLNPSSTYLFQSSSNTELGYDMYIRQDGNVVKWKWVEGMLNTGLLYGGVLSYSASSFLVTPGAGIIVDHNAVTGSEINPMVEYITWGPITQSIENIDTRQNTFVYIDNEGSASQQNVFFVPEQYQFYIPLGRISHYDNVVTNGSSMNVQTAYDIDRQQNVFIRAFGPLKLKGVATSGQTGTLRLNIGSGTAFNLGGYYDNDPNEPSVYNVYTNNTASIVRIYRSGSGYEFDNNGGSYYTTIDPGYYDDGTGILAAVNNNDWSIQRVMVNPITGRAHVYYSQNVYDTYDEAIASVLSDEFVESDATANSYVFSAYLVVKGNTTDLTNDVENKIVQAGLFRNIGGGGGTGGGGIPGGQNTQIQFNNMGVFDGNPEFTYNYTDSIVILTGSMFVSGAISASLGPNTVGFYGTASWAQNAIQAVSASIATTASYALSASQAVTASYALTASFATTSSYASSSPNFANTDLVFTTNRKHSTNNYSYFIYSKLVGGNETNPFDGIGVSGSFHYFNSSSNVLGTAAGSTSTYTYIEITSQSIDLSFNANPVVPSTYVFANTSASFSSSLTVTKSVFFPGLTSAPYPNIVVVDTSSGKLYYSTASVASFSGADTQIVFYSGSTAISSSSNITYNYTAQHFLVTGSTTLSGSTYVPGLNDDTPQQYVVTIDTNTGQLFYTSSNALSATSIPLDIRDEGIFVTSNPIFLNFTGSGVSASISGSGVNIHIPGGGVATPGGFNTQIQFNSSSVLSGSSNFTFDYINNAVNLTGSMFVSGTISASFGPNTIGFFGTASWAQSASQAISASYALSSSYAISASYALSSSYAQSASYAFSASYASSASYSDTSSFSFTSSLAYTASFITASNVWGPYGSSSVLSASYAVTAGYALNGGRGTPAPSDTYIQFNSGGLFGGNANFRYIYTSESLQHGASTTAYGTNSHAEGNSTISYGNYSHAEGAGAVAIGRYSHAEGSQTSTGWRGFSCSGISSGLITLQSSNGDVTSEFTGNTLVVLAGDSKSYIFTYNTVTYSAPNTRIQLDDITSILDGLGIVAVADITNLYSLLANPSPLGEFSHAEGANTRAIGYYSHAEGNSNIALDDYQLAIGQFNQPLNPGLFIIGDGDDDTTRHNILVVSKSYFEVSASNVFLKGLTNTAKTNVITIDTNTGQLFYTASNAIGGGGSGTPTPPASPLNSIQFNSASAFGGSSAFTFISASSTVILTGSLITSGSTQTIGTASFTGSTIITGSVFVQSTGSISLIGFINTTGSILVTGSVDVKGFITASKVLITSSGNNQLVVMGSGSSLTQIYGSQGNLLTVNDSLSGSLFTVSDISGYPILDVNSDSTVLLGNYQSPALYTTAKITTVSGINTIYSLQTASYNGAFFDYTLISGTNARAGQIMSIWNNNTIRYTETTTTDIGSTSEFIFSVALTAGSASLQVTGSTGAIIKTIIKSI